MRITNINPQRQINRQIYMSITVFHLDLLVYFNVALTTTFLWAIIIDEHQFRWITAHNA